MEQEVELRPVYHKGVAQLYDMFIDGAWHGSRRTIGQCNRWILFYNNYDAIQAERQRQQEEDKADRAEEKNKRIEAVRDSQGDLSGLRSLIDDLFELNPDKVASAKEKPKAADWFVGQVLKKTKEFEPLIIRDEIQRRL